MNTISSKRHRFPSELIRHSVWLYFPFTLSIRDVEELLAQRGIEVSREAVRCWTNEFGPLIAANLRRRRSQPTGRWHLDEMVVRIAGRRMYLGRAVDNELAAAVYNTFNLQQHLISRRTLRQFRADTNAA